MFAGGLPLVGELPGRRRTGAHRQARAVQPLADCGAEDLRRTVEVNLNGVVYGTLAAYPVMLAQGIVNLASLGGLVPAPRVALYAATKHGVVGFSTALRSEARAHGVRVSVACPGFVATPIRAHTAEALGHRLAPAVDLAAGHRMAPATCAAALLRGLARNQGIIVFPAHARLAWWLYRLAPAVVTELLNPRIDRRLAGGWCWRADGHPRSRRLRAGDSDRGGKGCHGREDRRTRPWMQDPLPVRSMVAASRSRQARPGAQGPRTTSSQPIA